MEALNDGEAVTTGIDAPAPDTFRAAVDRVFRAQGPRVWSELVAATMFDPYDSDLEALLRLLRAAELGDNTVLRLLARSQRIRLAAYLYRIGLREVRPW